MAGAPAWAVNAGLTITNALSTVTSNATFTATETLTTSIGSATLDKKETSPGGAVATIHTETSSLPATLLKLEGTYSLAIYQHGTYSNNSLMLDSVRRVSSATSSFTAVTTTTDSSNSSEYYPDRSKTRNSLGTSVETVTGNDSYSSTATGTYQDGQYRFSSISASLTSVEASVVAGEGALAFTETTPERTRTGYGTYVLTGLGWSRQTFTSTGSADKRVPSPYGTAVAVDTGVGPGTTLSLSSFTAHRTGGGWSDYQESGQFSANAQNNTESGTYTLHETSDGGFGRYESGSLANASLSLDSYVMSYDENSELVYHESGTGWRRISGQSGGTGGEPGGTGAVRDENFTFTKDEVHSLERWRYDQGSYTNDNYNLSSYSFYYRRRDYSGSFETGTFSDTQTGNGSYVRSEKFDLTRTVNKWGSGRVDKDFGSFTREQSGYTWSYYWDSLSGGQPQTTPLDLPVASGNFPLAWDSLDDPRVGAGFEVFELEHRVLTPVEEETLRKLQVSSNEDSGVADRFFDALWKFTKGYYGRIGKRLWDLTTPGMALNVWNAYDKGGADGLAMHWFTHYNPIGIVASHIGEALSAYDAGGLSGLGQHVLLTYRPEARIFAALLARDYERAGEETGDVVFDTAEAAAMVLAAGVGGGAGAGARLGAGARFGSASRIAGRGGLLRALWADDGGAIGRQASWYINRKYRIDMRGAPPGSPTNAAGYPRNRAWFWRQMLNKHPELFSKANRTAIRADGSPIVDARWLRYFPRHRAFRGDILAHHHINGGAFATPLPWGVHWGQGWFGQLHPPLP